MNKMKESGVEWIGSIPETWQVEVVSKLFTQRNTKVSDFDFSPLSVTKQGIVPQLESAAKSDDHSNRKLVRKGDFVINSRSDRKMSAGLSEYDGSVSLINLVMTPCTQKLDAGFVKYQLKNCGFAEEFYRWGTGIVSDLWSTNWERGKRIQLPLPSLSEQQKIAKFLDEKSALIDEIISDTKKTIEELQAYKKSLISEVVTKGLNPNVTFVLSGVEWIGKIPEGWKIQKCKFFGSVRNGLTYKPTDLVSHNEGVLVLRSGNIQNGKLSLFDNQYVSVEIPSKLLVNKNDILITSRNGSVKMIGKSAIVEEDIVATFGAFMMLFTPNKGINPKFFYYLLNSNGFDFYRGLFSTSTINQLTKKVFDNMIFPLPSIAEQKLIVDYLDKEANKIEGIISEKEALITEYENYKKSMIYEYVTGKKQVED